MEQLHSHPKICNCLKLAAAFSLVLLGGCASLSGGTSAKVAATTKANYYPNCYEPVSQLRSSDAEMQRAVATGAVTGGLLGGLVGALSGGDNAGRNVLIGAATGALVGGAAGYYTQRQKQISDDHARIASYGGDFEQSTMDLDRSIVYAKSAQDCYNREFENLRAAHKAKSMSDAEGRERFTEIVSGLKETNALLAAADGRAGEDINTYQQAYEKDLQQIGVERQAAADAARAKQVTTRKASKPKPAAQPVPREVVNTETQLQKASAKRSEAQEVSSRGSNIISSACSSPDVGGWADPACSA
ncbi:hypothetical protein D9M68_135420 [compost metagenome]